MVRCSYEGKGSFDLENGNLELLIARTNAKTSDLNFYLSSLQAL